jgi:hypothetical protein
MIPIDTTWPLKWATMRWKSRMSKTSLLKRMMMNRWIYLIFVKIQKQGFGLDFFRFIYIPAL